MKFITCAANKGPESRVSVDMVYIRSNVYTCTIYKIITRQKIIHALHVMNELNACTAMALLYIIHHSE